MSNIEIENGLNLLTLLNDYNSKPTDDKKLLYDKIKNYYKKENYLYELKDIDIILPKYNYSQYYVYDTNIRRPVIMGRKLFIDIDEFNSNNLLKEQIDSIDKFKQILNSFNNDFEFILNKSKDITTQQ
jgi:hypothetical protein